jgi:hypothetical protein
MATTNNYLSFTNGRDHTITKDPDHIGTSSTAADLIEVRWQSITGTTPTGITRLDLREALVKMIRFIDMHGQNASGTGLPAN